MSFSIRASLAVALTLNVTAPAFSADSVRLVNLAAASGYTYSWLGSESGVSLVRPGVVIILHAGYPIYDVNETPVQADRAPQFEGGDLVVSPALADRLRRIAVAHPSANAMLSMHEPAAAAQRPGRSITGALTIHARQIPGHESLELSGTAPAGVPITITITGEISTDLPTVLLSRVTVISAGDGSYSTVTSIDRDSHRATPIAATATSVAGITPAVARILVDAPNPNVSSSLDAFPPK